MRGMAFAAAFLTSINYFLKLEIRQLVEFDRIQFLKEEEISEEANGYDFVIVGAGTSGCILANRLSKNHRVLLLDAGTTPPSLTGIPALYPQIENFREGINYFYNSIPQNASFDRVLESSVGKMLGGSYSHNAMIFNRGSRYDYDNWAKILKDDTFAYKNMLTYFKKLENYMGDFPGHEHGTKGLIPVETDKQPISDTWYAAGRELGYATGDPNGVPQNIFTPIEMSRYLGRRCTSYTQYIEPILETRSNLLLVRLAVVDRVKFTNKVATSVVYRRHGKRFQAKARKEVILTAGNFGTAMILFKSGLGPRKMLEKAEIPVVKALPIGENFEDHPVVSLHFAYNDASKFHSLQANLTPEVLEKYLRGEPEDVLSKTSEGPQAFIATHLANKFEGKIWPDLQFVLSGSSEIATKREFSIDITSARPAFNKDTIGKVKLNTKLYREGVRKATDLALIDYKILQSQHINNVLLEGIQIALKIGDTVAFKSIGTELIPHQQCSKEHKFKSVGYWKCFLKNTFSINRHPVGTCRMGRSPKTRNGSGVVNTKFQVFGVKRLRVADASVIPKLPSANINVAVAVLAEKAASEILCEYGGPCRFKKKECK